MSSYIQSSFNGGEWSAAAQGNVTHPEYRTALNTCLNWVVMDADNLQRRPGTLHCLPTRSGGVARLLTWDFKTAFRHTIEVTDGIFRFRRGPFMVSTNDSQTVTAIAASNPATITTATAHGWTTGESVFFNIDQRLLQNRFFIITVSNPTNFTIRDGVTGANIDGALINAFTSGTVSRILEVGTPYLGGSWSNLRLVQANLQAVLLNGTAPQVLTVTQVPTTQRNAEFEINPAVFTDGPYLDAVPGSWITSSAVNGVVTLTLTFQPYDNARAYDIGDYVESGGQGYKSLTSANQGNAPPAAQWSAVNGGDPINGGAGFTTADEGRLLRLYSEPELWDVGTTFAANDVVAYEVSTSAAASYWKNTSGGNLTSKVPGVDTGWTVVPNGAIWTWAKMLSVANTGVVAPNDEFGSLTGGAGVNVLFDGSPSKAMASAANTTQAVQTAQAWGPIFYSINSQVQYQHVIYQKSNQSDLTFPGSPIPASYETVAPPGNPLWVAVGATSDATLTAYGGGHYTVGKSVQSVTVYPSTDLGFVSDSASLTLNLRGKATLPASASDGTLLGSTGSIANTTSPVSIVSSDQATAWNYIWIEISGTFTQPLPDDGSHNFTAEVGIAQVIVYSPNVANGSQISAQILGDALLYSGVTMRKWRLGAYGGSNGWPTCGTYYDDRLVLSGVIDGRVDASNTGDLFNMAPTAPNGAVALSNAFTATATESVNPVFWMEPHEQGIICGTPAGEFLLGPASTAAGLGPGNISFRRRTKINCANIEPRTTDHTLLMVQRYQRDIQEYFADVFSGKFSSPSLEDRARHTTVSGIEEIAYQQKLASIVWARLGSGGLVGVTYKRNTLSTARGPDCAAHHRHTLGHGRAIISICIAASTDGALDALQMVTRDDTTGLHHVELMTNLLDEGFSAINAWLLDDAIAPSSFTVDQSAQAGAPYGGVTINGLWSHNGKTVQAYVCGIDCGEQISATGQYFVQDFTVDNGSIFIAFGDGVSGGPGLGKFTAAVVLPFVGQSLPAAVGFTYNSDGQLVRAVLPQESGARSGPALGKLQRHHYVAANLYGTMSRAVSFGTSFDDLIPLVLNGADGETEIAKPQLVTSVVARLPIEDDDSFNSMPCWRISRPWPAMINAVQGFEETKDV